MTIFARRLFQWTAPGALIALGLLLGPSPAFPLSPADVENSFQPVASEIVEAIVAVGAAGSQRIPAKQIQDWKRRTGLDIDLRFINQAFEVHQRNTGLQEFVEMYLASLAKEKRLAREYDAELTRLQLLFVRSGGQLRSPLPPEDTTPGWASWLSVSPPLSQVPQQPFESKYFREAIDLEELNRWQKSPQYRNGIGLYRLLRDLMIVTGNRKLSAAAMKETLKAYSPADTWSSIKSSVWRTWAVLYSFRVDAAVYTGQQGYFLFAKQYTRGNLQTAYMLASAILSENDFAALGWGKGIPAKVSEVPALAAALAQPTYRGRDGYFSFAKDYTQGALQKAYVLVSAILSKDAFAALDWGKGIPANVSEVPALAAALAQPIYRGREGYFSFAKDYTQSNLQTAYVLASAILPENVFAALGWGKEIHAKVSEVPALAAALAKPIYQGRDGYFSFATDYTQGDLQAAYMLASAILSENDFAALGWGKGILAKVSEVPDLVAALAEPSYLGRAGYFRFAKDYTHGALQKAYVLVSAILPEDVFAALGWGKEIHAKVSEVPDLVAALAKPSYRGRDGYFSFATDYTQGDLQAAYMLASAILSETDFATLGWGKEILAKVTEVPDLVAALAKPIYQGREGYFRFAKDYTHGDLQKAHMLASAILPEDVFAALGWGKALKEKIPAADTLPDMEPSFTNGQTAVALAEALQQLAIRQNGQESPVLATIRTFLNAQHKRAEELFPGDIPRQAQHLLRTQALLEKALRQMNISDQLNRELEPHLALANRYVQAYQRIVAERQGRDGLPKGVSPGIAEDLLAFDRAIRNAK